MSVKISCRVTFALKISGIYLFFIVQINALTEKIKKYIFKSKFFFSTVKSTRIVDLMGYQSSHSCSEELA